MEVLTASQLRSLSSKTRQEKEGRLRAENVYNEVYTAATAGLTHVHSEYRMHPYAANTAFQCLRAWFPDAVIMRNAHGVSESFSIDWSAAS